MSLDDALQSIKVAQFKRRLKKEAGIWQGFISALKGPVLGERLAEGAIAAGTAAAVTAAGVGVKKGFDAIKERLDKPKAFKAMVSANPSLRQLDSKRVQMGFNSLYHMSPGMAKDPLIAGSFVSRTAEGPGDTGYLDPMTAKTLAETEARRGKKEGPIMSAFARGAGTDFRSEDMEQFARKERIRSGLANQAKHQELLADIAKRRTS